MITIDHEGERYSCLFLYDYVSDNEPCNFPLFLVSEQLLYFVDV